MKILLQFWQNPLWIKTRLIFSCLALLLMSKAVFPNPGIIESLELLIKEHREQYTKYLKKVRSSSNPSQIPQDWYVHEFKIDPLFTKSILLHSEEKYLNLITSDICQFASLIESDLLKTSLGYPESIPLIFKDKQTPVLIGKVEFLKGLFQKKCFSTGQASELFNSKNIKKTLEATPMPVPKISKDCSDILTSWRKNPYLPYLCQIPEKIERARKSRKLQAENSNLNLFQKKKLSSIIREGDAYSTLTNHFQQTYLTTLCDNIENEELFCKPYLAKDVWTKVLNGEKERFHLSHICKNLYQNKIENIEIKHLAKCAKKLNEQPITCTTKGFDGFPGLFPKPNCELISKAFNVSRLKADYMDCPSFIDNSSLTNIHRLISHLSNTKYDSTEESCYAETNKTFAQITIDTKNENVWPLRICYDDKIKGKNTCEIFIPGRLDNYEYSEEAIITKILKRMNQLKDYKSCKLVPENKYKPILLEYKHGCFIIYNPNKCLNSNCPKKIIVDNIEIKNVSYQGVSEFDYFPTNYVNARFSATEIITKNLKKKFRNIKNLTELEVFLRQSKNGIIHGVGCIEDLLPNFFEKSTFNQCSPTPFIIDGILEEKGNKYLVLRTSLDNVHAPRLVHWNSIFSALSNFREIHPLKSWLLYGTY